MSTASPAADASPERKCLLHRLGNARLVLLAPPCADVPATFGHVESNAGLHAALLSRVQRFRGAVYLQDGAIPAEALDGQGRYHVPVDDHSWQLVVVAGEWEILACLRLTWHRRRVSLADLGVSGLVERMEPCLAKRYETAVNVLLERAHRSGMQFGEVGGSAAAVQDCGSSRAILLACACWSFGQLVGGGLALAMATERHHTARILRRLGGAGLAAADGNELPGFFDPYYACDMEILGFDSRRPSGRYAATVAEVCDVLRRTTVVTAMAGASLS